MSDPRARKGNPEAPGRSPVPGQFVPDNSFQRQVAELRQAMVAAVTPKDMKQITEILVFHAQAGDLRAIKMVYQWVLGKPSPMPDPDRQDLEEWDQAKCRPSPEEVDVVRQRAPVAQALSVARNPVARPPEQGARVEAVAAPTSPIVSDSFGASTRPQEKRTTLPERESHRNGTVSKRPATPGDAGPGSCP
jgi:hypothetical protein